MVTVQPTLTLPFLPIGSYDCASAGLPGAACSGITSNLAWAPLIDDFDGFPMALVPAGCFMMGNEDGAHEEQPVHRICIEKPYWIDLTEITVGQYAKFMDAISCGATITFAMDAFEAGLEIPQVLTSVLETMKR